MKPTRIVQLQAENVKRLRAIDITPQSNVVVVGGRNAQGKTSVLDSISMALGGKDEVPTAPIRQGETEAHIVLDLGDIVVRRTFSSNGGTSLDIREKDETGRLGPKLGSPQSVLDRLTGKLTFDPLAFIRLEPKAQGDTLRKLVGLDFATHDAERSRIFAERTGINREVDRLRTLVASTTNHADAPASEVASTEILAEIEKTQAHNKQVAALHFKERECNTALATAKAEQERLARIVEELKARLADALRATELQGQHVESLSVALDKARADAVAVEIDVAPMRARLAELEAVNRKVRENAARAKIVADGRAAVKQAEDLTKRIDAMDADRAKQIKSAKYPVEGLAFSDSGVMLAGVPFEQASASEQLRVSVAVAAALNPQLRVMLVRDGSLLDDDALKLLAGLAEQHNLQVWLERVGKGAEVSVVIEDGSVVAK